MNTFYTFFPGQDTRIRFSLEPYPGDPSYNQWKDAMKMVARLPEGVPTEFRRKVHKCIFHCVQTEIKTGDSTVTTLMRKRKKRTSRKIGR